MEEIRMRIILCSICFVVGLSTCSIFTCVVKPKSDLIKALDTIKNQTEIIRRLVE